VNENETQMGERQENVDLSLEEEKERASESISSSPKQNLMSKTVNLLTDLNNVLEAKN